MQKKTEYEEAVDLYFEATHTGKQDAEKILLQISQKSADKILKSKAAYFLGVIHLTLRLQEALKKSDNAKPTVLLMQSLEWLKKAHAWGNVEATLLLGKIYSVDGQEQLEKLEVFVAGKLLGKVPVYDENLLDSIYAPEYLLAMSKDKEAAQILHRFAVRYLVLLDELVMGNGKRLQGNSLLKNQALRPMFTEPVDLEYHQQITNKANVSKMATTRTEFSEATPVSLFEMAESFADKGAYHAMEQSYHLHSAKTVMYVANYKGPRQNPKRAITLAKNLWQRRLTAFKKAIEWLENTKELTCQDDPSAWNMEFYRLNLIYLEARIAGMTHEKAFEMRNEAVDQKRAELRSKQRDALKLQFFSATNPGELYRDGLRLIEEQQFQQASKVLQQALTGFKVTQAIAKSPTKNPLECGQCYLALARCFKETQRYEDALLQCDEAVEIFKEQGEFDKIKETMEIFRVCLNQSKPTLIHLMEQPGQLFADQKFYQAKEIIEYLFRATRDTDMWVEPLKVIAKLLEHEKLEYPVKKRCDDLISQEEKLKQEACELRSETYGLELQVMLLGTEQGKLSEALNKLQVESTSSENSDELLQKHRALSAAITETAEKLLGLQRQLKGSYIRLSAVMTETVDIEKQLKQPLIEQTELKLARMNLMLELMQSIEWFASAAKNP